MSDPLLTAAANLEAVQRENAELQRKRDLDANMIAVLVSDLQAAKAQADALRKERDDAVWWKQQISQALEELQTLQANTLVNVRFFESQCEQYRTDRDALRLRVGELEAALRDVLDSAFPHPVEHPGMTEAWDAGRAALAATPAARRAAPSRASARP